MNEFLTQVADWRNIKQQMAMKHAGTPEAEQFSADGKKFSAVFDELSELYSRLGGKDDFSQKLVDKLEQQAAEIERLTSAIANPLLAGINIGNGSLEIGLQGGAAQLMAGMFLGMFEKHADANNYIECTFGSPQGNILVTVVRPGGKTPGQLHREAERELEEVLKTQSATQPCARCAALEEWNSTYEEVSKAEIEKLRANIATLEQLRPICPDCAKRIDEAAGVDVAARNRMIDTLRAELAAHKAALTKAREVIVECLLEDRWQLMKGSNLNEAIAAIDALTNGV